MLAERQRADMAFAATCQKQESRLNGRLSLALLMLVTS
jgi:hypothetical protein